MSRLKPLLLALFLLTVYSTRSQSPYFTVTLLSPTADSAYGPGVFVNIKISSTYSIASVVASVESNQISLPYNSGTLSYNGNLSLSGLVTGAKTLQVVVTDAIGNTDTITCPIIYHLPPVVNITQPYNYTCARPYLPVKATCFDSSGSCTLTVTVIYNTTPFTLGTFTNSVDTVFDLSGIAAQTSGNTMLYGIQASNLYNETSGGGGTVFTDMSPFLTEVYSDTNQIVDFSDNRVLVMRDGPQSSPRIVRITDSSSSLLSITKQLTSGGTLTSQGAVFSAPDTNTPGNTAAHIYDWNGGILDTLTASTGTGGYVAKGQYCAYTGPLGQIYLKNLAAGTTQLVTNSSASSSKGYDVAANGSVVYVGSSPLYDTVVSWQNGIRSYVPDLQAVSQVLQPKTDGKRIIYLRSGVSPNPQDRSIWYFNGTSSSAISDFPSGLPLTGVTTTYQIDSGYAAYIMPGTGSTVPLWVTDSSGATRQASFFSTTTNIDRLNGRGNLLFTYYSNRYLSTPDTVISVMSIAGKTYSQDSVWYVTMGRTLFRLNASIPASKVDSFSEMATKDSQRAFSVNDFSAHFEGSGIMTSIKILRLPAHGSFQLNGANVTPNQVIPRSSIYQLVYTPASGFTGTDTIGWNATNGAAYAPWGNVVVLRTTASLAAPPMPAISGLQSHYCAMAAAQKVRITNFPGPAYAAAVSASIDGKMVAVGSDSTVTIDPNALGAGSHQVKILFVNAVAGDTLTNSFIVDSAATPKVQLGVNADSVTASSGPVQLTASALSGGGSTPSFTFARDLAFAQIVQAAGSSPSASVPVSSLTTGKNIFYVRMATSDTCYTAQSAIDSVVVTLYQPLGPPPAPAINGLQNHYCQLAATQKVRVTNIPGPAIAATVSASIDGKTVPVASDSTVTINPGVLGAGAHQLDIIFANTTARDTLTNSFTVNPAVTPKVRLSASADSVTASSGPVQLTASALSGGGSTPLFTFARDLAFAQIVQGAGSSASASVPVSSLTTGKNTFYVRMRTSDTCYTTPSAIDSITVTLRLPEILPGGPIGLADTDNPGHLIYIGPNPFSGMLTITGLMPSKSYAISLYSDNGQEVIRKQVSGQQQAVLYTDPRQMVLYYLQVYDETRGRVIGVVKLLAIATK